MGAIVTTTDSVWIFEIDRLTRRNSVDSSTAKNLVFMLHEANISTKCHAAILTGAGGWFCAGSDLEELAGRTPEEMSLIEESKAELARTIGEVDIPVIAAVSGFALGGGLSLAAACDYVVADEDSRWHMPEVNNGWLPPWGIEPVMRRCGEVVARQVLWGLEALNARDAQSIGLVDIVTPAGGAFERARMLAGQIASLSSDAVRSVKAYQRSPERANETNADALASRTFKSNCATTPSQLTLSRFGPST